MILDMEQSLAGSAARIKAHDALLRGLWRALYYHRDADAILIHEWRAEIRKHQAMLRDIACIASEDDAPLHWIENPVRINPARVVMAFLTAQERAEFDEEQHVELERIRTA